MNSNKSIDVNTLVQRNEAKFLANKIGEEMVMMNMETGDFITMNIVGADIWAMTEAPLTVRELIDGLMSQYDLTEEKCMSETVGFLNRSTSENMFILSNPGAGE